MTSHHSDILLPREAWSSAISRSRLAAFVPIVLALFGVVAILFGGISARTGDGASAAAGAVDPVITGSIVTPDQQRALEMLDR